MLAWRTMRMSCGLFALLSIEHFPSVSHRRPNGEPFTDKSLYKLFWTSCYRLTGKRTNPHLVRDSIVTFLRGGGATERELEVNAWSGK